MEIFACDASGGRSVPDELNVIRKGVHYGFPWRFSDEANPTLDPSYDAAADPLVPPGLQGSFAYDPTFPAAPVGVDFVDPVVNHGPDLITARDPSTGSDAATSSLRSFTYNSEPIALVFDNRFAVGCCGRVCVCLFVCVCARLFVCMSTTSTLPPVQHYNNISPNTYTPPAPLVATG